MIVCGTAGTGKSYLINAIVQCLGDKVIVSGTTGMAAFHICGATVHSVLQLPIRSCNKKDLQGSALIEDVQRQALPDYRRNVNAWSDDICMDRQTSKTSYR